tara:strand:+ start:1429 stop:2058 length:630 start_codon:yes stop_codon:yes gene_type:complete
MSSKDGIMVVLSSPSGAGKTTLVKKISNQKGYKVSISHTTRKPRTNEINGKDYIFIGKEEFSKLIDNNEFLEYAEVFKNLYGSSKEEVLQNLKEGKRVIFDIDWQGTDQIKKNNPGFQLITFFILPPSKEELFERLLNRDMKDRSIALERMKQFKKDVLHWKDYDFTVINDDLQKCYDQILDLLNSKLSNTKSNYNKSVIEEHINKLLN